MPLPRPLYSAVWPTQYPIKFCRSWNWFLLDPNRLCNETQKWNDYSNNGFLELRQGWQAIRMDPLSRCTKAEWVWPRKDLNILLMNPALKEGKQRGSPPSKKEPLKIRPPFHPIFTPDEPPAIPFPSSSSVSTSQHSSNTRKEGRVCFPSPVRFPSYFLTQLDLRIKLFPGRISEVQ